jgi:transposase-like protein
VALICSCTPQIGCTIYPVTRDRPRNQDNRISGEAKLTITNPVKTIGQGMFGGERSGVGVRLTVICTHRWSQISCGSEVESLPTTKPEWSPSMDPHNVFCPNPTCPATAQINEGDITIHSRHPQRYRCNVCQKTFSARKGTPLYRLSTPEATIVMVLTLIAYGCPLAAIEAAFGFQRRTVQGWVDAAGEHCEQIHQHLILNPRDDLEHVQADELRVKTQRGIGWMAMAIMVSSRLWLGGVVSTRRDKALSERLVALVRACASPEHHLLVATEGLVTYMKAFAKAFRCKQYTGRVGAPRLIAWPKVVIWQVVKRYQRRRVIGVERRLAKGSCSLLECLLERTQGGGVLNTAYIEQRLNATFRARLGALVRRTRGLAHRHRQLHTEMYLVGTVYNFCTYHASLSSIPTNDCSSGLTPAMAAGITGHRWSMAEVLEYHIRPARSGSLRSSEGEDRRLCSNS